MNPAAYRNKREHKLVRRDTPHPDAANLWEPLYPEAAVLPKAMAILILTSLEELVADPQISFGPAFELARHRQEKAVSIMRNYLKTL